MTATRDLISAIREHTGGVPGPQRVDGDAVRSALVDSVGETTGRIAYSKGTLDAMRCIGLRQARSAEPFAWATPMVVGSLVHAVLDQACARARLGDPVDGSLETVDQLTRIGLKKLADAENRLADYVAGLDHWDTAELFREASNLALSALMSWPELFTASTATEGRAAATVTSVSGHEVRLSGRTDIVAVRGAAIVDMKTGRAWPSDIDQVLGYAAMSAIRFQTAPRVVAVAAAGTGDAFAVPVDTAALIDWCERVGTRVGVLFRAPDPAPLDMVTPGPWCMWCPRVTACSAAATDGRQS